MDKVNSKGLLKKEPKNRRALKTTEKRFYSKIFHLALPIIFQNLINTAVNSADVVMLGFINQSSLSAASLANQISFVLNLFYSGVSSGVIMLCAQYWGKKQPRAIEKIMGIAVRLSMSVSILVGAASCLTPGLLMRIFTSDQELISMGSSYLRILGFSYLFMGFSQVYLCVMRSIERVMFSAVVTAIALISNILLNAVFIFGLLGAPALGIQGAALATAIARGIELAICICDNFRKRTVRFRIREVFSINRVLFRDFLHYSLPALGNDVVWGVGFSMYSVIMGHLGSDIVAANSIVVVARNLGTAVCFGIASASAILLGKEIGDNQIEKAKRDTTRLYWLTFWAGVAGGILILFLRPVIMNMAELTAQAREYLGIMLYINVYYTVGQAINTMVISGAFRSGGDSRFGFICDTINMWIYAVPLGFLSAFVLKLPPMVVYFLICTDEFVKMPFVYRHYKSYRWLKNITRDNVVQEDTLKQKG